MLRINLLPPYIYEGKRKKQLGLFWGIAAAATVGGFLFWLTSLNKTLADENDKLTAAKTLQTQYEGLVSQISTVNKEIDEVKQKQTFIANAQVYNDSWRPGLMLVRDVVNPRIVINAINFDQTRSSVQMSAFAPSEMDAIKWWMVLLNQNDKFTNVNITLPPHGYQPGGGTGAASAPGGFGGGGSMGMPGGGMSRSMPMGMPPGGSMGGGPSMSGFGGGGSSFGGGGGGSAASAGSTSILEGRTGFDFVCTAGLVNPLKGGSVAPSWAGVGAGGAGAAPGGGMGMMGGGMGMPPGGSMGGMGAGSMGMPSGSPPAARGKGGGTTD